MKWASFYRNENHYYMRHIAALRIGIRCLECELAPTAQALF